MNIKSSLLVKAIDRTNVKFIPIDDCKNEYSDYYSSLFSFNPKVLGGKVPDKNIYYVEK